VNHEPPLLATLALIVLMLAMGLVLIRALKGPTVKNRILAVNSFSTLTILWLCVYSVISGRTDVIDIGTIYALIGFVSMIAVLKYVQRGDLGVGPEDAR
jgi:multicomponent Na+:H+ antiporter subunit F